MPEMNENRIRRSRRIRHRGRSSQVQIYLGKQLRFFINENDWKVLPMAAIIAALVGMVIRKQFFVTMEGSLFGGFALTCVAIWNGCFNSIQVVCRERPIIKREHRSGMHITSYVAAHMIYQLMLCTLQTGLTMYVLRTLEVNFPAQGLITPWMVVDIGISILLISYASDMLSLFLSSISRTTTGAMTLMPSVQIFQLVFSGGIIPLPSWSQNLSDYTISNYGIRAIAAQSGYNELPMATGWNTLKGMRDRKMGGTVTVGQMLDFLNSPEMEKYRDQEVLPAMNIREVLNGLMTGGTEETAAGSEAAALLPGTGGAEQMTPPLSLGDLTELLNNSEAIQAFRDQSVTLRTTVGELMDIFGEDKIRDAVQRATAEASYKGEYAKTTENIVGNWFMLGLFIFLFALLSVLALEMIDKDRR